MNSKLVAKYVLLQAPSKHENWLAGSGGDSRTVVVSTGIWVIHTGPKSGSELVTLFDSDCDDGVSALIVAPITLRK